MSWARGWTCGALALLGFACAAKPTAVQLGGTASALDEKETDKRARPAPENATEAAAAPATPAVVAVSATPSASAASAVAVAPPASVEAKVGGGYARTLVLSVDLRATATVGGNAQTLDVTGSVRHEVRFKVTGVKQGRVATLALTYGTCRLDFSAVGRPAFSEEMAVQGKSYDVEVAGDDLKVSASSRTTLSDSEVAAARGDARSYLAFDAWLHAGPNKSPANSQGLGHLLPAPDQHLKISEERMTFRGFDALPSGEQAATYDVHLALAGGAKDIWIKSTLDGTVALGTQPSRPLALHASGPLTLAVDDDDMAGSGSGKLGLEMTFAP